MMRSLRSRLIVGMLVGMAVLLAAAGTTIYTVQRRQLYQAFDDTLLGSANALTLLIHPGPFGNWFDREGLARLPAGQIREGAVFRLWSDQPIDIPPRRPGPDADRGGPGPPPREDFMDDGPPPDAQPPDDRPPRGGRHPRDRRAPPDDPGPPDESGPGDRRRPDPPIRTRRADRPARTAGRSSASGSSARTRWAPPTCPNSRP